MSQSLSAVYIHLVFSTKDRRPFLRDPNIRSNLHAYLGGISKTLDCAPLEIGGADDHVHLLCQLGRTISQADWIKELKRVSSIWLKKNGPDYREFQWQGGYATFSVSDSKIEVVRDYIRNQETRHAKQRFQDEVRFLLRKHNVSWDERYIWD